MLVRGVFNPLTTYVTPVAAPQNNQVVARPVSQASMSTQVARAFVPSTHTITDAVAAGLGVYAIDMLLPTVTGGGNVDLPFIGKISGVAVQSMLAGAATLTASSIENAIGLDSSQYRLMGLVSAGDYVAKGVVPVVANELMHKEFAGVTNTLVDSLKVYSGTQLGIIAKNMITGY